MIFFFNIAVTLVIKEIFKQLIKINVTDHWNFYWSYVYKKKYEIIIISKHGTTSNCTMKTESVWNEATVFDCWSILTDSLSDTNWWFIHDSTWIETRCNSCWTNRVCSKNTTRWRNRSKSIRVYRFFKIEGL